jgi:hypothetical protein
MRDYDGKQSPDFMGRKEGKGVRAGSLLGEFFPPEVKAQSMKVPSEIARFKYPDTADAIYAEQEGDVKMADRDRASSMRRK